MQHNTRFMKKFTLSILLCCSAFCFGQNDRIEQLINEVSEAVVPKDFNYFNLVDSSFAIDMKHLTFFNSRLKTFVENNPEFKLSASNGSDTINWRNYKITRAHIYAYDDIPKFATHSRTVHLIPFNTPKAEVDSLNRNKKYNEVFVPVKKRWSESRIEKEVEKKWDERNMNTIQENKTYFIFSTPVFSPDNKYAIIQIIRGGENSITYVFKQEDNKWILLSDIDGYVY